MGGYRSVAALIALGLGLAACGPGDDGVVADIASFTVGARDLRVTVSEKGALKARNQILIRPTIPGQAKIVSLIDEGTLVVKGDVLCELDSTAVTKEIQDLSNRVIQLEGEVKAAVADLEIQLSQNDADVQDAELELQFAKVELERFTKGEFVQEETKRKTRVAEAKSGLARAKRKFDDMPALQEEGFVTENDVEEERINLVKAQSELELAELDLSTYLKYSAPKDKARKEADVRNAGLEIGRSEKRAIAREAQKRAKLDRQNNELANVEDRLADRSGVLEQMIILAPGPGIVIYGDANKPWDDREIKVGESVYSKQAFLTLPDLREMQVVLAIHEADISRISVGQAAHVVVETARGRSIDGEVTHVALVPNSARRRWGDSTKRFEVVVSLTGDLGDLDLKPGLTSRVEILVEELQDVLAVPSQAVFAESGKFWVFRGSATGYERAEVKIAPGNSRYVVLTEGIAAGDQVALYNPERAGDGGGGGGSALPKADTDKKKDGNAPGRP